MSTVSRAIGLNRDGIISARPVCELTGEKTVPGIRFKNPALRHSRIAAQPSPLAPIHSTGRRRASNRSLALSIDQQVQDLSRASRSKARQRAVSQILSRNRIGRYELLYPIGSGGMATVYAGRLCGLAGFERMIAIKIIHPHLAQSENFVKMFLDEACLAARIHHPNVGEIFEVGHDDGLYYMVGELISGQDLNQFEKRARENNVIMAPPLYTHILARACRGLHAAHTLFGNNGEPLNLVHRDISPKNIVISFNGTIKLIDFGIAWAKDRHFQTEVGHFKGKLGFTPPEQLLGKTLDRRSDIFSMGVVLYQLATGQHPFPGKTAAERIDRILKCDFTHPREVKPSVPIQVEEIIVKALSYKRQDRYTTAALMANDLDRVCWRFNDGEPREILARMMRQFFSDVLKNHNRKISQYPSANTSDPQLDTDTDQSACEPVYDTRRFFYQPRTVTMAYHWTAAFFAFMALFIAFGSIVRDRPSKARAADVTGNRASMGPTATTAAPLKLPPSIIRTGHVLPVGLNAVHGRDDFATISLKLHPKDATVKVDSTAIMASVKRIRMRPDDRQHRFEFSKPGYVSQTRTIRIDRDIVLNVKLKRSRKRTKIARKKKPRRATPLRSIHTPRLQRSPYNS